MVYLTPTAPTMQRLDFGIAYAERKRKGRNIAKSKKREIKSHLKTEFSTDLALLGT